jgi:CrcB protein
LVYLFVGAGGIIGSLFRYLLSNLAVSLWGNDFPFGTLFVNLSGAFFLGWFSSRFVYPKKLHPNAIVAISTGIAGSYTTFSTFSLETIRLLTSESHLFGVLYMGISLLGGLVLVSLGLSVGDLTKKRGNYND